MNKNETFPQKDVFINKISSFLPNQPVTNDEIENYIGKIDGKSYRARSIILRQNKIITRYYALNTDQRITHSISEFDQSETFTTPYTYSAEFATNFGFDATFGENVKRGLKFGSSSKETIQITNSVVKTLKSDDLGSVIINFGDEIIMNDEWISTGLGWRGYRSRLNYNPKYKTAYYTLHVAPLFYGN